MAKLAFGPEIAADDPEAVRAWLTESQVSDDDARAMLEEGVERLFVYRGLIRSTLREALRSAIPRTMERLGEVRTDWTLDEVRALAALPFNDLIYQAQRVHRRWFDANTVQISTLLSIKTGACPEDCSYCSQSVRYDTGLDREALLALTEFVATRDR